MEVYVLVNRKKTIGIYILDAITLVLAIGSLLLTCVNSFAIISVVLFGLAFYATHFLTNIEYEYAYFGGEIKIAKITNKSRRKRQMIFSMDEVSVMAPHGHDRVRNAENDKMLKVRDFTSHDKNVPFYVAVVTHDGDSSLVMFEPDEAFLKEICIRYPSKIVKPAQY